MIMNRRVRLAPDGWAVIGLVLLWAFFFWRLLTPTAQDALSLKEGDFSGQFVSWTSYSVARFAEGEIPLWNPYMNAGAPFLADPQTAVLYPPRLLTVTILGWQDTVNAGEVYAALQIEMALHVLGGTLVMYIFLRRVTGEENAPHQNKTTGVFASFLGALTFGYGGFLSAYPPLQLPLLETFVWFPLVMLGIHEATRPENKRLGWQCMVLAGVGGALATLAGHPQTLLFIGYTAVAYLIYRRWQRKWQGTLGGGVLFGMVAAGLSAALWLPAFQFQAQTYRENFGVDDKGVGFHFQDVLQFLFPDMLGQWSPLYLGVPGLILVGIAIVKSTAHTRFWIGVGVLGLLLSFGQRVAIYDLIYILVPGFAFFRGQERAALLVAMAGAVLVALGAQKVLEGSFSAHFWLRRVLSALMVWAGGFALIFFVLRLIPPNGELYQTALNSSLFSLALVIAAFIFFSLPQASKGRAGLLVALVIFDLFSVNMANSNYEPIPAQDRLPQPPYIALMQSSLESGQRAEGLRGIGQSYGALYRMPDIWGDSPLRLNSIEYYLWRIPIEKRWELLAVEVVNSEWEELPVPHTKIGAGEDDAGRFNVYRLDDPRPFALMIFKARIEADDAKAREIAGGDFPLRTEIILNELSGDLPTAGGVGEAQLVQFEPETIKIQTQAETAGVLSLALPYDGNWQVEVDDKETELLKAYGGLSAIYLPAGTHRIELTYAPMWFYLGAIMSAFTLLMIIGGLAVSRFLFRRKAIHEGSVQHGAE